MPHWLTLAVGSVIAAACAVPDVEIVASFGAGGSNNNAGSGVNGGAGGKPSSAGSTSGNPSQGGSLNNAGTPASAAGEGGTNESGPGEGGSAGQASEPTPLDCASQPAAQLLLCDDFESGTIDATRWKLAYPAQAMVNTGRTGKGVWIQGGAGAEAFKTTVGALAAAETTVVSFWARLQMADVSQNVTLFSLTASPPASGNYFGFGVYDDFLRWSIFPSNPPTLVPNDAASQAWPGEKWMCIEHRVQGTRNLHTSVTVEGTPKLTFPLVVTADNWNSAGTPATIDGGPAFGPFSTGTLQIDDVLITTSGASVCDGL